MQFISVREFNSSPGKTRAALKKEGKLVLTNNGKPSMLVLDIVNQDFEDVIDILNRAEAMKLLDGIQLQAARGGLDTLSMDEVDKEIGDYRREKRGQ
ncbi:hypothetical protein LQZ19_07760 [Treponema primitia]|uniref:hypothetical protein n=1 Tax=Treponema primitia TaxID=88058 RepID=UPI00397F42DE